MTRFFTPLLILLAALTVLMPNTAGAADLSVNSLRIGTHPDKTRIVVEVSRQTDFRAFTLQNPSRLVLDLPAFDWRASLPPKTEGSLVNAIRNGVLQPGISRIVIELDAPVILKSAFFLPAGPSISDRVVMDIERVQGTFNPTNEKMFGSLDTRNPSAGLGAPSTRGGAPTGTLQKPANFGAPLEAPAPPSNPSSRKGPKPMIVIDPGHGGQDPGAIGSGGRREKDITLAAAKELAQQLESTGRYRVHLTRTTDKFIKLQERVAIGRRQNADLFISLHADSIDKPNVRGASIYTLSNKASDAQTAKLAARENQADLIAGVDLSHEDKEVANILIDLAMRDTMNQSKFFANTVVTYSKKNGIRMLEKPHRFAGFAVLKAPDVPSVLIEIGFMSNKSEVDQLSSPAYRQKIARSIATAIDTYFDKVQKNSD